jgi:hypothetical protein
MNINLWLYLMLSNHHRESGTPALTNLQHFAFILACGHGSQEELRKPEPRPFNLEN